MLNLLIRRSTFCTVDIKKIEAKWRPRWSMVQQNEGAEKFYCLVQFPYPSGNLHLGHARVYFISDVIARYNRMRNRHVIHPIGWDSFGLPAENAAISRKIDPKTWTEANIKQMKGQLEKLGISFDWERELATHLPDYYEWTQYIFLQLYKHGLAYKKEATVNWDPVDQTVLANEQVDINGNSWRSGAKVQQKTLNQWFFKITEFAEDLDKDLQILDGWPENVKQMQSGWIGLKKEQGQVQTLMRDWLVSRQRYWGVPIPMINCSKCGIQPVPQAELPVLLPPSNLSEGNPLLTKSYRKTVCPKCNSQAERQTDTLDTFVDSSWYFLRYLDRHNSQLVDKPKCQTSMPVDVYIGGIQHAIMHLLYARFIYKFLQKYGYLGKSFKQPFFKLVVQGLVKGKSIRLKSNGKYLTNEQSQAYKSDEIIEAYEKMSKSKLNGVNPTDIIDTYGSDALRMAMMFSGPVEKDIDFDEKGVSWMHQFLISLVKKKQLLESRKDIAIETDSQNQQAFYDKCVSLLRDITACLEGAYTMHVYVARLIELNNHLTSNIDNKNLTNKVLVDVYILLVSCMLPVSPHVCSEILESLGKKNISWPTISDLQKGKAKTTETLVSINNRLFRKMRVAQSVLRDAEQGKTEQFLNLLKSIEGFSKEPIDRIIVRRMPKNYVVNILTRRS